jgi:hypothetical protein
VIGPAEGRVTGMVTVSDLQQAMRRRTLASTGR